MRCQFTQDFTVQLNDALRHGAIVRGMEVDEEEVVLGEQMAPDLKRKYFAAETVSNQYTENRS